ncbi:MAG: IS110 family transposase [Rikenellaceae bacterium]
MRQVVRQTVGIDVSKKKFDVTICMVSASGKESFVTTDPFDNSKSGFNRLIKWVRKTCDKNYETTFVMEATGVYHENLAYFLHELNQRVVIALPNKVKNYAKCLNIKSKTDKIDSKVIAKLGSQQQLMLWQPPKSIYRKMRALTRMYQDLKKQRLVFANHIESFDFSFNEDIEKIGKVYKQMVDSIDEQIKNCENALIKLVNSDEEIRDRVVNIQTIKGIGFITTVIIVAETFGFDNINSCKQLASYAGLDVVQRQSGSSVNGRSKISKKGNSRIRGALYIPAVSACTHNTKMKEYYQRVNKGKTSKQPGVVAIERKLLILMYTLWKKNESAIA